MFKKHRPFTFALITMMTTAVLAICLTSALHISASFESGKGEVFITDTSNVDPDFDPKEALGAEVLEQLKNASPTATVARDPYTGETIVIEGEGITSSEPLGTEPFIPDNSGVTQPPLELINPESIIEDDNRKQISNVDTYPYNAITLLEVTYENGARAFGSGAFVSHTAILTAGHVIYSHKNGWATSVRVIPGGTNSEQNTATTSDVLSVNGWVRDGNWDYDYGLVRIAQRLETGYFGTKALSNSRLSNKDIYNYGFPDDKEYGTLWYDSGTTGTLWNKRLLHNADTRPGNSGGPIVLQSDPLYIVGVHSDAYNSNYNIATRVTDEVIDFIRSNTEW